MKKAFKTMIIISLSGLVLFACKKEEDDPVSTPKSKTALLAGTWMMTNLEAPPPLDTVDIWTTTDPCLKDVLSVFNSDGTGYRDEGAIKCDASDPQQTTFTWEWFNSAETEMRWIDDDDTLIVREISITSTTFIGKQDLTGPGQPFSYIKITLTRQ